MTLHIQLLSADAVYLTIYIRARLPDRGPSTAHLTHGCGNSLPIKTGTLLPHNTKIKNRSIQHLNFVKPVRTGPDQIVNLQAASAGFLWIA
jgi:hypothetical protein